MKCEGDKRWRWHRPLPPPPFPYETKRKNEYGRTRSKVKKKRGRRRRRTGGGTGLKRSLWKDRQVVNHSRLRRLQTPANRFLPRPHTRPALSLSLAIFGPIIQGQPPVPNLLIESLPTLIETIARIPSPPPPLTSSSSSSPFCDWIRTRNQSRRGSRRRMNHDARGGVNRKMRERSRILFDGYDPRMDISQNRMSTNVPK